jgi:hypothetical protein
MLAPRSDMKGWCVAFGSFLHLFSTERLVLDCRAFAIATFTLVVSLFLLVRAFYWPRCTSPRISRIPLFFLALLLIHAKLRKSSNIVVLVLGWGLDRTLFVIFSQ